MAKATAKCTCETCGNTFYVTATKSNRKEADNFEAWAEKNYTTCRDCWKEEQRKEAEERGDRIVKAYSLPEITGVSQKQIDFAASLRKRYVADPDNMFPEKADEVMKFVALLNNPEEVRKAEEMSDGMSLWELFDGWLRARHMKKTHIVLYSTDAREIIDALK